MPLFRSEKRSVKYGALNRAFELCSYMDAQSRCDSVPGELAQW